MEQRVRRKLSLAEGGTFRAQGLLADGWDDGRLTTAAMTGTGTWETHGQDANQDPTVRLTVRDSATVFLYAVHTDEFEDLEMEVHKAGGVAWCRLSR